MPHRIAPPFRADQVGSLLRPPQLTKARKRWKSGHLSGEKLRESEDSYIAEAVRRQESVGMQVVTDGEFRRDWWHLDFLSGFDGIELWQDQQAKGFGVEGEQPPMAKAVARVSRTEPIMVEHFVYLRSVARVTPKISIPGPAMMHLRPGDHAVERTAYPDMEQFWADLTAGYRAEVADLYDAGCRYLQIDDVSFAYLCDGDIRSSMRARGDDPADLAHFYTELVNEVIREKPEDMTISVHMCRGNFKSSWVAEGGYEPVAETILNEMNVHAFFMEYDTDRAGGFEPLRFLPGDKVVVLGLVTSKSGQLESPDALKRRLDEADRIVPLERLCLSPQCGFSSTHHGNALTQDDQWRKLELIVRVAEEVWGSASGSLRE